MKSSLFLTLSFLFVFIFCIYILKINLTSQTILPSFSLWGIHIWNRFPISGDEMVHQHRRAIALCPTGLYRFDDSSDSGYSADNGSDSSGDNSSEGGDNGSASGGSEGGDSGVSSSDIVNMWESLVQNIRPPVVTVLQGISIEGNQESRK
jgi:hypothetical protein